MKVNMFLILFLLFSVVAGASEAYIVLNEDNSIFTVSDKNDTAISEGQRIIMRSESMQKFCSSLPAHPSLCRLVGQDFVYDETLKPDTFYFDLQAMEGELFEAFKVHASFASVYAPIKSCFGYLKYPYTDKGSIVALATLKVVCDNLVSSEVFSSDDYDSFKSILAKYRITLPE